MEKLEHYNSYKLVKYLKRDKAYKPAVTGTGLAYFYISHDASALPMVTKESIGISELPVVRISSYGTVNPHGKLGNYWNHSDDLSVPDGTLEVNVTPFTTTETSRVSIVTSQENNDVTWLPPTSYSCSSDKVAEILSQLKHDDIDWDKLHNTDNKDNDKYCYAVMPSLLVVTGPAVMKFYDKKGQLTIGKINDQTHKLWPSDMTVWVGGQIVELQQKHKHRHHHHMEQASKVSEKIHQDVPAVGRDMALELQRMAAEFTEDFLPEKAKIAYASAAKIYESLGDFENADKCWEYVANHYVSTSEYLKATKLFTSITNRQKNNPVMASNILEDKFVTMLCIIALSGTGEPAQAIYREICDKISPEKRDLLAAIMKSFNDKDRASFTEAIVAYDEICSLDDQTISGLLYTIKMKLPK